jgi:transposase
MYRITLDEAAKQELQRRARSAHTARRTRDRLEMVRLANAGWRPAQIAAHMGVCSVTARTWIKAYLAGGFEALVDRDHPGPPSRLTPEILKAVREELRAAKRTYTAPQLAEWVQERFGLHVSAGWLRRKLRSDRLAYKRTHRSLHHKRNPQAVEAKTAQLEDLEKRGSKASSTLPMSMSSAFR